MTDDQEEIFEQFCAQYFPYRLKDRYQEEGWLALPVTAGIMTGIYGLIRKDRKNEE
jgi:hypothetical protein